MQKKKLGTRTIQLVCGKARPVKVTFLDENIARFCKEFNEKTKDRSDEIVSVKINVYRDKSYDYEIGTFPCTYLLKNRRVDYKEMKADGRKKAQEEERKEISADELEKIAREKLPYLNTDDLEKAKKIVAGTVRSFNGVKINE